MLTVNVSDFVVQDILEQLWTIYVYKYGENDAKRAEKSFYDYRRQPSLSPSPSPSHIPKHTPLANIYDKESGANDAKRKYMKQYSEIGVGLLSSTSALDPVINSTTEQKQNV